MKKNTVDNILGKKQYKRILDCLEKYPEGLDYSELLFLLSGFKVRRWWEKERKFIDIKKENRTELFTSKSRLCRVLEMLGEFNLIHKDEKKYRLSKFSPELKSIFENKQVLDHYLNIVKYHLRVKHEVKNLDRKYKRFKLEPPSRNKKGKEFIANSIILHHLQIYGTNMDVIPEKKLNSALHKIQEGVKEIEKERNKKIKKDADSIICKLKSNSPMPRDKYLRLRAGAIQSGEEGIPGENATTDELKEWEINRLERLFSANIKRQETFNITLIYNTNKNDIVE